MNREYSQFWADNPCIHGMYERPVAMFPRINPTVGMNFDQQCCYYAKIVKERYSNPVINQVRYVGYGLFVMLMMAVKAGMVTHPYPSYITKKVE